MSLAKFISKIYPESADFFNWVVGSGTPVSASDSDMPEDAYIGPESGQSHRIAGVAEVPAPIDARRYATDAKGYRQG